LKGEDDETRNVLLLSAVYEALGRKVFIIVFALLSGLAVDYIYRIS
jgi:hypothetical protein